MSMLDEDEEYEEDSLYERRGTPVLRSARPELVVPTPLTSRRWTGAPNSKLWPRACAATGKRVSMSGAAAPVSRPAVLGGDGRIENACLVNLNRRDAVSPLAEGKSGLGLDV